MEALKSKLVIFLCVPLVFLFVVDTFALEKSFSGICTEVLDGDTIVVAGQKVRLANIDAPEKNQHSFDSYPIGAWSTNHLRSLILNKYVRVTYTGKGRFGRVLGTIWLEDININKRMLSAGMAIKFLPDDINTYNSLEHTARLKRIGIFGVLGFMRPDFYRRIKR